MYVSSLPALRWKTKRLLESGIAAGGAGAVKKAYTICAMLFAAVSLKTAIENQYFYATNNIGTSTRGVLSTVRAALCCRFFSIVYCRRHEVSHPLDWFSQRDYSATKRMYSSNDPFSESDRRDGSNTVMFGFATLSVVEYSSFENHSRGERSYASMVYLWFLEVGGRRIEVQQ